MKFSSACIFLCVVAAVTVLTSGDMRLSNKVLTYEGAVEECRRQKARLPEIDSLKRNIELYQAMKSLNLKRIWLGVTRHHIRSDAKPWKWVYASKHEEAATVHFWGPQEPNNYLNHTERCVEMRVLSKNTDAKNWNDRPCHSLNHFYCLQ